MTDSAPSSPIFSSVNYGDESDEDILDFGPGRSVFEDASGIPDIDTIDHSTLSPVTAVNPLARRIIMDDFDTDDSDFEGDDMFSTRKLPLGVPLDDTDEEELTSSEDESTSKHRESQHSLPDPEELKLAVAATTGGGSSFLCSYSTRKRILYPALLIVFGLAIVVFFAHAATRSRPTATAQSKPVFEDQTYQKVADDDDTVDIPHAPFIDIPIVEDRYTYLLDYLIQHGVTSPELFRDPETNMNMISTPQAQAARWLAHEDHQFPDLPSPEQDPSTPEGYALVSRYAMAVLYFTTNGKDWNDSLNFVDPNKDTCDWYQVFAPPKGEVGIVCDKHTRQIIGLSMSK